MESSLPLFLVAVALGAYAQTVTGFALGIFVLSAVVLLEISSIATTATALNFMSVALGVVVVIPRLRSADWRVISMTLIGLMPAMVVGVLALRYLSAYAEAVLRLLLGLLIVGGGLVLICRPKPRKEMSSVFSFISIGSMGGLLGGLFSVPAPPLVYQLYRQPLSIETIRVSLVALFGALGLGRLIVVGLEGNISLEVVRLGVLSIPVVIFFGWLGGRLPPKVSDTSMRRFVFAILVLTGGFIIYTAFPL
jgi:uncharacterized protein